MPIITQTTPNQNSTVTTTTVNANSANTTAVLSPVYTNNSLINKTVNAAGSNSSFGTVASISSDANDVNGISTIRPEVISIMDFKPVFNSFGSTGDLDDVNLSKHGKLLDLRLKTLALRRDNLIQLISSINESLSNQNDTVSEVIDEFNNEIQVINSFLNLARDYYGAIEDIKTSFDISKLFSTTNITYDFSYNGQNQSFAKNTTIEAFLNQYSQIPKDKIETFSNTKLFQQIVVDTRGVLEKNSFALLADQDPDRVNDTDPVSIDTTYSLKTNFDFLNISPRNSVNSNATSTEVINNFYTLLGSLSKSDRIKLLITLFSKEYRISKGLGNSAITDKLNKSFNFAADSGSPFGNIFGSPADDIFTSPAGGLKTVAALGIQTIDANSSQYVLPFEQKLIKESNSGLTANNQQQNITSNVQYLPGSSYFVESILNNITTQNNDIIFNTQPVETYINNFTAKINDTSIVIRDLMQANDVNSNLWPLKIYYRYLSAMQLATNKLTYQFKANKQQAIIAAIFRLANKNDLLKKTLFEYLLLYGIVKNKSSGVDRVFSVLQTEMKNYKSFPILSSIVTVAGDFPSLISVHDFNSDEYSGGAASNLIPYISVLIRRIYILISNQFFQASSDLSQNINSTEVFKSNISQDLEIFDYVSQSDIETALLGQLNPSSSNSVGEDLVTQWLQIASELYSSAAGTFQIEHVIQDGSYKTRLSSMSTSMQLLVVYEIMLSMVDLYVKTDFVITRTYTAILFNPKAQNIVNSYISDVIAKSTNTNQSPVSIQLNVSNFQQPQYAAQTDYSQLSNTSYVYLNSDGSATVLSQADEAVRSYRSVDLSSTFRFNQRSSAYQDLIDTLLSGNQSISKDILICLAGEMKALDGYLQLFDKIKGSLQKSLTSIKAKFDNNTNELLRAYANYSNNDFRILREKSQLQNSLYLYDQANILLKESQPIQASATLSDKFRPMFVGSPESGNNAPSETEIAMLRKLLSQDKFLGNISNSNRRMKIVSVGIPSGFTKRFTSSINKTQSKNSAALHGTSNVDIVKVNIYKRNHSYGELVFKPLSFIFDTSMYQETIDFNDIVDLNSVSFDKCVANNFLLDYESLSNTSANKKYKPDTIQNFNPKYSTIPYDKKIELWKNHLTSYLLGRYTNYTTNLSINEFNYFTTSAQTNFFDSIVSTNINQKKYLDFRTLILKYIQERTKVTIDSSKTNKEIIADKTIPEDAKDVIRLLSNGSMISSPNLFYNSVLSPKLFERVFFIPIDAENDFELDMAKTNSTPSGRTTWGSDDFQQNKLITKDGKYYLIPTTSDQIVLDSFFVTIEEG